MTWLAYPLFNLLLRVNRFGRLALSREQTVASNWVGACVFLALAGLLGMAIVGADSSWMFVAMVFSFLMLPLAGVFRCSPGWPRKTMIACTIFVALVGFGILAIIGCVEFRVLPDNRSSAELLKTLVGLFLLLGVGSTWAANILAGQRPKS